MTINESRRERKTQGKSIGMGQKYSNAIGNNETGKEASRRDTMRERETMNEMGGREIRRKKQ